jgi:hypothetical protein
MSLDLIVAEVDKEQSFKVNEGDFVIKTKDPKIIKFLRWLCGL